MSPDEARARLGEAPVARLATVSPAGRPHVVPICFALDGDTIVTAIDHKPKRTTALARLRNIEGNPAVAVLADHYDEADWAQLWWVRADGIATVVESSPRAIELLAARYEQYRETPPGGPAIEIAVHRWSGWAAT
jgi:PPOX class probable F420-dependent enzyme